MLYKVNLYIAGGYRETKIMSDLIVEKNSLGVFEITTRRKIKISTQLGRMDYYQNCSSKMAYNIFVKEEELSYKNLINYTETQLENYIRKFPTNEFNKLCELGKTIHKTPKEFNPTNVKQLYKVKKYDYHNTQGEVNGTNNN